MKQSDPMDLLTHIFFPLTALYVLKKDLLNPPYHYLLVLFALLPDLDKLIGIPGLLHSLLTLTPLILAIFLIEKIFGGSGKISGIASIFILSHLLLDIVDGGIVPLLYPIITKGVGIIFPLKISVQDLSILGAPIEVVYKEPKLSYTYEILNGYGIVSLFIFAMIYVGDKLRK